MNHKRVYTIIGIILIFIIWLLISLIIDEQKLIFPGPIETIAYLKEMLSIDVSYYISLNISLDDEYLDSEKQVLTGDLKFLEKIINLKSNEIVDVYPGQRIVLSIDDNVIKIV